MHSKQRCLTVSAAWCLYSEEFYKFSTIQTYIFPYTTCKCRTYSTYYIIISMCCCRNMLLFLLLLWLFCCWNWKVKYVLMKFVIILLSIVPQWGTTEKLTQLMSSDSSLLAHITATAHNHNRSIEWLFYNFLFSVTASHIIYNLLRPISVEAGAIILKYIICTQRFDGD